MRTEPKVRPVAAGAEVVVVNENGAAEAAGFPKPKLNPDEAVVDAAGVPVNNSTVY